MNGMRPGRINGLWKMECYEVLIQVRILLPIKLSTILNFTSNSATLQKVIAAFIFVADMKCRWKIAKEKNRKAIFSEVFMGFCPQAIWWQNHLVNGNHLILL